MIIRTYEPSDLDAVWELHKLALEATGAHLGEGSWYEDLRNIPDVYLKNQGCFFVGLEEWRIIAMGALKRTDPAKAEIKRMRIHPDFQRCGYGAQMLKALETEAVYLGYQTLHLDTTAMQVAAQKLYETHGYRQIGTGTVGRFNVLLYEKSLTAKS